MRVLHTTDTHLGVTAAKSIRKMLQRAVQDEEFDLLIHTGDFCGGDDGQRSVKSTLQMIRDVYDGPVLFTIGNHDFWCNDMQMEKRFKVAYQEILQHAVDYSAVFIDEEGPWSHEDWPDIKFVGASGWYVNPNPHTNDWQYLPYSIDGVGHNLWLLNRSDKIIDKQLEQLDKTYDTSDTVCFVSHFPVIVGKDHKGTWHDWSWSEALGDHMQQAYNCRYFFEGHSHKAVHGPLKYNSGSDYNHPRYHIVEIV